MTAAAAAAAAANQQNGIANGSAASSSAAAATTASSSTTTTSTAASSPVAMNQPDGQVLGGSQASDTRIDDAASSIQALWRGHSARAACSTSTEPKIATAGLSLEVPSNAPRPQKVSVSTRIPRPPNQQVASSVFFLPPQRDASHITLVLDLDATLIHCGESQQAQAQAQAQAQGVDGGDCDCETFELTVAMASGREDTVSILKRPHLNTFLGGVSKLFEIVVFTAAERNYSTPLLRRLAADVKSGDNSDECVFDHHLSREACARTDAGGTTVHHIKDLETLGRDLARVIAIDDSSIALSRQPKNLIL
jgi:hypothetical protein